MAAKPKNMHQIRKIIELKQEGKSIRQIVKLCGIARNTVREYLRRIDVCKVPAEHLMALDDEALATVVYGDKYAVVNPDDRLGDLLQRIPAYIDELRKCGVTRHLLWTEYRETNPNGFGYAQFCEYIRQHLQKKGAVMHFTHRPAEQMEVDFAGDKLSYVDVHTGEVITCEVLVCVLPYSGFTYVTVLRSQNQEDFIDGLCRGALQYFGGVPQSIKCDNMKVAVIKANRYEPSFTETMEDVARHYNTTILAARVRKPRDKATVENAVGNAYRRIYAPLRHQTFHSLEELKMAVQKQLNWHNSQPFQAKDDSRQIVFDRDEKALLRELPLTPHEMKHVVSARVQKNYHIILGEDSHQYSVPFILIGKQLKAVYTASTVEIYHELKRVAVHKRSYKKHGYTTVMEHMPPNHRHVTAIRGWDAEYFNDQASAIGPYTQRFVGRILQSKSFFEQTCNSCLGVLRLGKQYGNERLEAACRRAVQSPVANFGLINNILQNNLDKSPLLFEKNTPQLPLHENVRKPEDFQ